LRERWRAVSDKPLVDYSAELWRDQVGAFLREVVQEPAVIAGNSLGGFAALYAAASFPERVAGCVLLNAAGRFSSPDDDAIAAAVLKVPVRWECRERESKSPGAGIFRAKQSG